jgi:hypothetical protein
VLDYPGISKSGCSEWPDSNTTPLKSWYIKADHNASALVAVSWLHGRLLDTTSTVHRMLAGYLTKPRLLLF